MSQLHPEDAEVIDKKFIIRLRRRNQSADSNRVNIINSPPYGEIYLSALLNSENKLNIKITKVVTKSANVTIELQVDGMDRIIKDFSDWTENCSFDDILCPVRIQECSEHIASSHSRDINFNYDLNISCKIIWYGFVDELNSPNLYKNTQHYLNNLKFTDITIKVKDKEFKAHKIILASQSPVFKKILTTDMKESRENCINLPNIDAEVADELLYFLYHGKVVKAHDDDDIALQLFETAGMYQIEKLKEICAVILSNKLTVTNVVMLLEISEIHNSLILKERATTFIIINRDDIIPSEDFKGLCIRKSELTLKIIERIEKFYRT
ncbi:TD and POZ domain-containing protein 2-like [Microplitis mediator]|uniref:TD and POZ domain-containing protein 2-like n=1 Tax=Microplitis mediator TaxID=375433 RepID=UPI002552B825|nr:TD and POZ domain-containing protein 2-like [Microplitis mediator]XP_057325989.1 TD and POZ domain-containing protein 2-like [Microplitis mediator]